MIYTLKLNPQEMQLVAAGLSELPFKVVASLMTNVQKQVHEQEAADASTPLPEVPEPAQAPSA